MARPLFTAEKVKQRSFPWCCYDGRWVLRELGYSVVQGVKICRLISPLVYRCGAYGAFLRERRKKDRSKVAVTKLATPLF